MRLGRHGPRFWPPGQRQTDAYRVPELAKTAQWAARAIAGIQYATRGIMQLLILDIHTRHSDGRELRDAHYYTCKGPGPSF